MIEGWIGPASRRPFRVLVITLVLLVGAIAAASTLRLDTDLFSLVPKTNPVVSEFRLTIERFGSLDLMLLAVELPTADDPDEAELRREAVMLYADRLAEQARAIEGVEWLEYRLEDVVDAATELVPWAPLVMDDDGFERFLRRIDSPESVDLAAAELAQALRSPADLPRKKLRLIDPLDMVPSALRSFDVGNNRERFDTETGYLLDPGKTLLLMLVGPSEGPANLPFSKQLVADLRSAADRAAETWQADGENEGLEKPEVLLAGGHVIAAEDGRLITRDLGFGTALTLVAVVGLFAVAFGRARALIVAFVPLFCGLVLTAGLAALVLGRLNGVTTAFGALLLGLGIDFVIVFYGRYLEQREQGQTHAQALMCCARHTVPSILLGAGTTAVTFFAFLVSDFAGLWELGLLTGGGILVVAFSVLCVLPALLTLVDGRAGTHTGRFRLRSFGARRVFRWSLDHPRRALALNAGLSVVLATFAWQIGYDDDVMSMRSSQNMGSVNQQKIMDAFGLRFTPFMVRLDGPDEQSVLAKAAAVYERLAPLADGQKLARVDSLAQLMPSFDQQQQRLDRIRQTLEARGADALSVRSELEAALAAQGLKASAFSKGLDYLQGALSQDEPKGLVALASSSLGPWVRRYISTHDEGASTVIYCYPPNGRDRRMPAPELIREVEQAGAVLTGPVLISAELKEVVWDDALTAGAVGTFVVLLCLAFSLGGLGRAISSLVPLSLGLVWMLGLMAAAGVPMNYLNVFVLTMILGIGVDYGIHLMHRMEESGDPEGTIELAPAIAVAALTTVLGFGSLALSHVPALRSMGWAAICGVLSVAWLTLTLLPAAFRLKLTTIDESPLGPATEADGETQPAG